MADQKTGILRAMLPNVAWDALKSAAFYFWAFGLAGTIAFATAIWQWVNNHLDIVFIVGLFLFSSLMLFAGAAVQKAVIAAQGTAKEVSVPLANKYPAAPLLQTLQAKAKGLGEEDIPKERVHVDVAPEYLFSFYKEHTSINAAKLAEVYLQKWLTVSGRVRHVGVPNEFFVQVNLQDSNVFLYFKPSWTGRLALLRRADEIRVTGWIKGISRGSIDLWDCELLSASHQVVPSRESTS